MCLKSEDKNINIKATIKCKYKQNRSNSYENYYNAQITERGGNQLLPANKFRIDIKLVMNRVTKLLILLHMINYIK